MEYLNWGSLHDLVARGTLEEEAIALVCREVIDALVYLHVQVSGWLIATRD